ISCINQTKNGGRTLVVSTQGGETVRDNISCIFGPKQVQSLMEFQQKMPNETMLQEYGISEGSALTENLLQLEGCISSCAHGQGRSTTDRQFFYVNSRPCEPTKVIKLVNEVYHQFNQYQYPFVFLNLKMARDNVDVNVTPDKRQVFMDHEKLLTATIKVNNMVRLTAHAELEQESVLKSLTTTHISSGRTEQMKCEDEEITHPHDNEISIDTERPAVVKLDDEKVDGLSRKVIHMSVSIESIKKKIKRKKHKRSRDKHDVSVKFRTEIDPAKSQAAEQELRKEISQDMFAKMEILGQFNLGFIVTRLGSDLFIIDQHATDEKYNFEMLQLNTVLQNQRLVIPQKLDLTAVNESILIENEEIFNKNGFDFIIDEKAEPTKRVQLTAIPVSKNWQFGKEDIDELLFMLEDSPHTMCRPSRVRAMFASRACRKSVMIGMALSKTDMRRLVDHMGEIEQPWNCPHGRPTMRHLLNLDLIHNGKSLSV
ncbi:hypothetical protein Cfor_01390, partial [Coptotermes formosanus]